MITTGFYALVVACLSLVENGSNGWKTVASNEFGPACLAVAAAQDYIGKRDGVPAPSVPKPTARLALQLYYADIALWRAEFVNDTGRNDAHAVYRIAVRWRYAYSREKQSRADVQDYARRVVNVWNAMHPSKTVFDGETVLQARRANRPLIGSR